MSGSGKTYAGEAAIRFYPPASGQNALGDTSLENFSIREWHQTVRRGDAGRVHLLGQHCRQHRPEVEHIDKERLRHAAEVSKLYTDSSRDCHWDTTPG